MDATILQQVLKLLENGSGLGRNRNFASFEGPQGERVQRLFRLYASLARELEEAAQRPEVVITMHDEATGELRLELCDPRVAYRRVNLVPAPLAGYFRRRLGAAG